MDQSAEKSKKTSNKKRPRQEEAATETRGNETTVTETYTNVSQKERKRRGRTCLQVMATGAKEKKLVEPNASGQPVEDTETYTNVSQKERKKRGRTCLQVMETGAKEKKLVEPNASKQPVGDTERYTNVSQKERKKRGRTCLQVMATGAKEKKLVELNASGKPVGDTETYTNVSQKERKKRGRTCLQVMATGAKEKKLVESNASGQPVGDTETYTNVSHKERKKRGRTCLQVMATGAKEKKFVEWNARGQPVGDVSVKFSSTMGVIVREQVPITIDTWHGVNAQARDSLWSLLMQKYVVDVCFRLFIMQQMGKLWRSWKSELSTQIRKIMESRLTYVDRTNLLAKLRPHNVPLKEWDEFVQSRMSEKWNAKSFKMREIRAKQTLNHTLSRKGYSRKEHEHNKLHPDKPLTKPQLWIEAHVSKRKTSEANIAKIDEIKKKMDEAPPNGDQEEILNQVIGKEYPGRIRGLGAGVTKSKLYAQSLRDSTYAMMEAKLNKMTARCKKIEATLATKLGINLDDDESEDDDESGEENTPGNSKAKSKSGAIESCPAGRTTPQSRQGSTPQPSIHDKCKLINWNGNGEEVAKGSISAVDPKAVVHGYILGQDCYRVSVEEVLVESAEFYRYEPEFTNLADSVGSTIAWPIKYIVIDD